MSRSSDVKQLIAAISGQANMLSIPRVYIDFTGSVEAALLLSQIVYWSDRTKDEEGWFYKSYREWEEEITLSKYCVSKYVKRLQAAGVLETKVKKANGDPTLHYRLNWDAFSLSLVEFLHEPKLSDLTNLVSQKNELTKSEKLGKPLYLHRSHSEITSETTHTPERESEKTAPILNRTASEPIDVEVLPRTDPPTEPPVQPSSTQGDDRSAAPLHPAKKTDDRFHRGGRLEVWEIAINEPDPAFLDWLAANDKCGNSSLPPRTKAKRTLYNSRDRCDSLAADLWREFQDSGGRLQPQTYADKRAAQTYQAAMAAIADL